MIRGRHSNGKNRIDPVSPVLKSRMAWIFHGPTWNNKPTTRNRDLIIDSRRLAINTADRLDPRLVHYLSGRQRPRGKKSRFANRLFPSGQPRARARSLIATISSPESTVSKTKRFSSSRRGEKKKKKWSLNSSMKRVIRSIVKRVKFHERNVWIWRNIERFQKRLITSLSNVYVLKNIHGKDQISYFQRSIAIRLIRFVQSNSKWNLRKKKDMVLE